MGDRALLPRSGVPYPLSLVPPLDALEKDAKRDRGCIVNRVVAGALRPFMTPYTTHRDLVAWQQAMLLAETVYRETADFPKEEIFGLTRQIKTSAISVPSNIAEGCARNTLPEYVHFLGIACGSIAELETQLELAIRFGFMRADAASLGQADRAARLLRALRKSLKARIKNET